ncbi:MAG: hypothetical protein Tsb009_06180 [Planctomycetaceae bacterium]
MQTYNSHGVSFGYPDDWELREEISAEEITLTISSPGTSFFSITLYYEQPKPAELLETAIETFRSEYEEMDAYPVEQTIWVYDAEGYDLDFVSLDLVNLALLRSFQTEQFTVLIYGQSGGTERELFRTAWDAMTNGFRIEEL